MPKGLHAGRARVWLARFIEERTLSHDAGRSETVVAVREFDRAMQRGMAVFLAAATVQCVATMVAGSDLYARWWSILPWPVFVLATTGAAALCGTGRFTSRWCLAWALVVCVCGVLVAFALAPTHVTVSACTPIYGPACGVVGLLQRPRIALASGFLCVVPPNIAISLTNPRYASDKISFIAILLAVLLGAILGRRLFLRLASEEERELARLNATLLEDRIAGATWDAQREAKRRVHDHVINTLTALGHGSLNESPEWRARCLADAEFLRTYADDGADNHVPSLWQQIQDLGSEFERSGFNVEIVGEGDELAARSLQLPTIVGSRIAEAVREALNNARRYSGAHEARLSVCHSDGEVAVTVLDRGVGHGESGLLNNRGIENSIIKRVTEVGGWAEIKRTEPTGTTVSLRWPR